MLSIRLEGKGEGKTLFLSGKLDSTTASQLESEGIGLISKGCAVMILELSGLDYLSSSGLRAILTIAKKTMPSGGRVAVCGAKGLVKNALDISGFAAFLPVKESLDEAFEACSPKKGRDGERGK